MLAYEQALFEERKEGKSHPQESLLTGYLNVISFVYFPWASVPIWYEGYVVWLGNLSFHWILVIRLLLSLSDFKCVI